MKDRSLVKWAYDFMERSKGARQIKMTLAKEKKTNSVFANKVKLQFRTSRPGQHLLTDISYIYYGDNG